MIVIELQYKLQFPVIFACELRAVGKLVTFSCVECAVKRREEAISGVSSVWRKITYSSVFVELLPRAPRPIGHLTPPHLCPNAVLFGDVPKLVTCGSQALQFCQLHF